MKHRHLLIGMNCVLVASVLGGCAGRILTGTPNPIVGSSSVTATSRPGEATVSLEPAATLDELFLQVEELDGLCDVTSVWRVEAPYVAGAPFLGDENASFRDLRFSDDGSRMAYVEERGERTWVSVATYERREQLAQSQPYAFGPYNNGAYCNEIQLHSWSPTGEWLAYGETNQQLAPQSQLYVLDSRTGESFLIDQAAYSSHTQDWSPGSDRLAYVHERFDNVTRGIYDAEIRVATLNASGAVEIEEYAMPDDVNWREDSSRVQGLVWWTNDQLLVAITPGMGTEPSRLYVLDLQSSNWSQVAQVSYRPGVDLSRQGPIYLEPNGELLAWFGGRIVMLDTERWEVAHTVLLTGAIRYEAAWTLVSTAAPELIYVDYASSAFVFEPSTEESRLLFDRNLVPNNPQVTAIYVRP